MEHVNHPKHYNQHPAGIECIDIIRHYTCDIANALKYLWRAGLKPEMGKEDADKEIEDLQKARWYIDDYHNHFTLKRAQAEYVTGKAEYERAFKELTGHTMEDVYKCYPSPIREAIENLLLTGLIHSGCITMSIVYRKETSIAAIHQRIIDVNHVQADKNLADMKAILHGQAIDGEDYVSKPGCVRETEPEKYDPLNMIVAWGRVYSLTDEVREKPNGALYTPCENCDLMDVCFDEWQHPDTSLRHDLCRLHSATDQQYYREVGVAKYSPRFGTVEVVDELKESELELKRLEEEEN